MDTYYKECFVESVYHYKALENWQKFQIGDIFQLAYDDKYDIVKKLFVQKFKERKKQ